ncbi:hypothetical protein AB4624_18745, partial [Vibrio breoganii]
KPTSYTATDSNQVYTWDITYLPSKVQGQHYYLYVIEDIYSRKIVGYEVYEALLIKSGKGRSYPTELAS